MYPSHQLSFVVVCCRWLGIVTIEIEEAPISNSLLRNSDLDWWRWELSYSSISMLKAPWKPMVSSTEPSFKD